MNDEERLTTFTVLRKTYPFVILRFLVVIGTIIPMWWAINYFADFFFRLFGLEVGGMVHTIFWLNFAMIGCTIGLAVFGFVRKTVLFYIKAAHVIAITKICTDDLSLGSLTLSSFNEVRKRFISVNLFYIADGLILKGVRDIGRLILEQDIIPAVKPTSEPGFFNGLKNFGIKMMGKVIATTLGYCDEIVLSYVFVRSRLTELYGSDGGKAGKTRISEKRKKDSVKTMFGYAVDGLCLYVKNCIPLLKASFSTVMAITVFGWIVSVSTGIVIFVIIGDGLVKTLTTVVIVRLAYALLSYTFMEPYETVSLITEFYYAMFEDSEEMDLEPIKNKLLSFSIPFRKMVSKAHGRDEATVDEKVATPTGSLLDSNLYEIAKDSVGSTLEDRDLTETTEEVDGLGPSASMDENLDSIDDLR